MNIANAHQEKYKKQLNKRSKNINGVKILKKRIAPFVFLPQMPQIAATLTKKIEITMRNLKQIASLLAIAIIAFAPIKVTAQGENTPYIDQNAKAERKVTPDELFLSITISEKDNKGKSTVEEQQDLMIKELQKEGIDVERNLTLNFMGSEISYTAFRRNINPRTSATYTLKLTNAATMQKVISKLEANGITNTQLVKTNYSKADELYKELGIEAMKKAQAQAAALAGAIEQNIGRALSINSWTSSTAGAQPRLYKSRSNTLEEAVLATDSTEPQIEVGEITYTVNVNVRFLLKEE